MKGHSADIPGSPRDASSSTTHALVNVLHAVLEPGSHQHITDYINRNGQKTAALVQLSSAVPCLDGVADGPDADLAIGVARVQGGAVSGPGQGHAVGHLGLLADLGELGRELVDNALTGAQGTVCRGKSDASTTRAEIRRNEKC